jgi:glycosyltransferase involved in cell wall biosynthesis
VVVSSTHEGFCNVVAEALAAGTAVISTDCPHGPSEILENGRYGWLTPVGDAAAMARAMLAVVDEPRPDAGHRARGYQFTAEASAAKYAEFVERICRAPRV